MSRQNKEYCHQLQKGLQSLLRSSSLISSIEKSCNSKTEKEPREVNMVSRFSKRQAKFINASRTWLVCEVTSGHHVRGEKEQNSQISRGDVL